MEAKDDFTSRAADQLNRLIEEDRALESQEAGVRRKRESLQAEMGALRTALSTYRRLMGLNDDVTEMLQDVPEIEARTIADVSEFVIRRAGNSMKVADIARELEQIGRLSGDVDDDSSTNYRKVYATLRKNPTRFRLVGPAEFDLFAQTHPPSPSRSSVMNRLQARRIGTSPLDPPQR